MLWGTTYLLSSRRPIVSSRAADYPTARLAAQRHAVRVRRGQGGKGRRVDGLNGRTSAESQCCFHLGRQIIFI